jgi:hypothetical protein
LRAACVAVWLGSPIAPAIAQEGSGVAVHQVGVGSADFGDATIRERQTGLRWWSFEHPDDDRLFRVAVEYAYTRYEFDNLPTRDRDLHHVFFPMQVRGVDESWLVMLSPVIATSSNVFKDLVNRGSHDDYDIYARLYVQRPFSGTGSWAKGSWRLGLLRDAALGRVRGYPEAAFVWRDARFDAELGLPTTRIDWKWRPDLSFGLAVFPAGMQWHVVSDERGGAEFDYRARQWRGALAARWQPLRWLRVAAQAGVEFARQYEFEDDTGAFVKRDADAAPYLRIDLVWVLR